MEYKQLGQSNLKISNVSFGCMSLGLDYEANARLLHQAFDNGINYFDIADLYQNGENEVTLGKAFNGMRNQIIIATKVGNHMRQDGSGWDWNPTKAYILEAVDKSLKRLHTDYIDLYQLHGGTIEDPIDETIEAFELLQQQGKIRYYGISSIRPNVIREYVSRSNIVSVMMQYSLLDRRPEENIFSLLQQYNIGVLARGSLAQGLLAGKSAKTYLTYTDEEVQKAALAIQVVAGNSADVAVTAVQYALAHPAVSSAVLGIRTSKQLADALSNAKATPLNEKDLQQLQHVLPSNKYEQHR